MADLKPVAWRCKDFTDGWIVYQDEALALEYQDHTGCLMQPLYVNSAPEAVDVRAAAKVLLAKWDADTKTGLFYGPIEFCIMVKSFATGGK